MRRKQVKTIIAYYSGIPGMVRLLNHELSELEGEYNGLHGTAMDGLSRGSVPGNPTELLAVRADEKRVWARMLEINVRRQVLTRDADIIRECLDAMRDKYKSLLSMKYLRGYSWAKISVSLGVPDATARRWNDRALERLGEILDDAPMSGEILCRASRARV